MTENGRTHRVSAPVLGGLVLGVATALLSTAGCVSPTAGMLVPNWSQSEPQPIRIVTFWERQVKRIIDTKKTTDGMGDPALAGRVLFYSGDEKKPPMPVKGTLVVGWFDASATEQGELPLLGECVIRSADLHQFEHKDVFGVGYTIMVPWAGYNPSVRRIRIHVRLVPDKGGDHLFAEPVVISLNSDAPVTTSQKIVPVQLAPGYEPNRQPNTLQPAGPGTSNWDWASKQPSVPTPLLPR
jgi:hypothetical protein